MANKTWSERDHVRVVRFGERVRKRRLMLGISQATLGRIAGMSQSTVSRIEHGRHPDLRLVSGLRLLEALQEPIDGARR